MAASRSATVASVIALLTVVAIGVVSGLLLSRRMREKIAGNVAAEGTPVGSFSFSVDDCASGHAFVPGFFGVDLRGAGGHALRVVGSGDDARLWLYPPGGKGAPLAIDKASCSEWDVLVEWARVTFNRVHTVSGHVRVGCALAGGKVTASAQFERCAL